MEFLAHQNRGEALSIAYNLWRCVKLRSWDESSGANTSLQQMQGVGPKEARALECMGIHALRQLANSDPHSISRHICRDHQFCSSLNEEAASIADFGASISLSGEKLQITVHSKRSSTRRSRIAHWKQSCTVVVWCSGQLLLFREGVEAPSSFSVALSSERKQNQSSVFARVFHDQYVGMDQRLEVAVPESEQCPHASVNPSRAIEGRPKQETSTNGRVSTAKSSCKSKVSASKRDSSILSRIKALERHHANAKQQSIARFLERLPEGKSSIPAPIRAYERVDNSKQTRFLRASAPIQRGHPSTCDDAIEKQKPNPATCVERWQDKTAIGERCLTRVPLSKTHTIPSDECKHEVNSVRSKAPDESLHEAKRTTSKKRKAAENLFARFRYVQADEVESDPFPVNLGNVKTAQDVGSSEVVHGIPDHDRSNSLLDSIFF